MSLQEISLLVGALGLLGTCFSIALAYYWYRRSLKEKAPCYAIESRNFAKRSSITEVPGLDVNFEYCGRPIENITSSRIAIWNAGRETIRSSDLPEADPLRIVAEEGYELLAASVQECTNEANQCVSKLDEDNIAYVNFDYLDYQDGFVVEVLHTGKTSWSINVVGSIRGGGSIRHSRRQPFPDRAFSIQVVAWGIVLIIGLILALLLFLIGRLDILEGRSGLMIAAAALLWLIIKVGSGLLAGSGFGIKTPPAELGVTDDDHYLRSPAPGLHYERNKDHDPAF